MRVILHTEDLVWILDKAAEEVEWMNKIIPAFPDEKELKERRKQAKEILAKVAVAVMSQQTMKNHDSESMEIDPSRN